MAPPPREFVADEANGTERIWQPSWEPKGGDPNRMITIKPGSHMVPKPAVPLPTSLNRQMVSTYRTAENFSFFGEIGKEREKPPKHVDAKGYPYRMDVPNLSPGPQSPLPKAPLCEDDFKRWNSAYRHAPHFSFRGDALLPDSAPPDPLKSERRKAHQKRQKPWLGPGDRESVCVPVEAKAPITVWARMSTERPWHPRCVGRPIASRQVFVARDK